ncbi:MAG: polyphosphate kinase 1 [Clostridiales bacterium]|nr:polyphosphate kinase 1 [Clostridiales bacterium]
MTKINYNEKGDIEMKNATYYENRELSWLKFNERVLNEAGNPEVPLAQRLSFAAIYQSNLDEFYMVRVGSLTDRQKINKDEKENKTGMTPKEQINAILKRTKELEVKKARIYEQLMGELEPQGIRLINFNKLSKEEGEGLEKYFNRHIAPFLSPMIISKQQPFPFFNNKTLYAIVLLNTAKGKTKIGVVPCENSVFKRLIEIPTRPGTFMLCEELILHFVYKLFSKYTISEKTVIRVTRNADIDTENFNDDNLDYRDMMGKLIKKRTRLNPVRVEITRDIDNNMKSEIAKYIGVSEKHIIKSDTPLDLSFGFLLQNYLREKPELFYEKRTPRITPELNMKESIISQVEKKDVLLSYPFESMKPFLTMLHEAAEDENVVSIKLTLYRVAERSKIIETLIEAAENGKEVVVMVELRARFDEENNIEVSRMLEDAGCRIIYGLGKYKVHSKLCLITKSTDEGFSYIAQVGTGNYNEKTSKQYTDLSLLTANQELGAEISNVFNALMLGETIEKTNHLLVAPKMMQNKIIEMIDNEIDKATSGQSSYIGIKINSLTDKDIIDKLIEASKAGVHIDLIVRGICCLRPGIEGVTDNINIISIVGRFLEHSRIYRFGTCDDEKIYISSADFMTRNTIRRVEVATPIYDEAVRNRIRHIFDVALSDNVKGKRMLSDGTYSDIFTDKEKINSQEVFYQEAYDAEAKG